MIKVIKLIIATINATIEYLRGVSLRLFDRFTPPVGKHPGETNKCVENKNTRIKQSATSELQNVKQNDFSELQQIIEQLNHTWVEFNELMDKIRKFLSEERPKEYSKIIHLAVYGKTARIRKKNRAHLIRLFLREKYKPGQGGIKMIKDMTRDYATSAFRTYASLGKPTYEELKKRIYEHALLDGDLEPSKALMKANAEVKNKTPLLLDVLAVEKTLEMLTRGKKEHIAKAVEAVYFAYPKEPLNRNAVIDRVRRFAYDYGAAERTVFYWLKEARLLFSAIRGLRIDDDVKSLQ